MTSLKVNPTEDSPEVNFSLENKLFRISGESRPENAGKFYNPIISWLKEYENVMFYAQNEFKTTSGFTFEFRLDYFNSTSAKYISDIMVLLRKMLEKGYQVNIKWFYDSRDDDMMEAGKEFAEISNIEMEYIGF